MTERGRDCATWASYSETTPGFFLLAIKHQKANMLGGQVISSNVDQLSQPTVKSTGKLVSDFSY